ncbi:MAG: (2Fe-2S)-binding protein [Pseudomonadota bacterium]
MFVCVCNAYRSSEIAEMARRGFDDAEDLYHELGCGPICRRCLEAAQDVIDAERRSAGIT